MRAVFVLLAATCLTASLASSTWAADAGVEATIRDFGIAFNKGDVAAAKALHAASPTITDEGSPFSWTGPGAFYGWLADLAKSEAAEGKTGGRVSVGAPTREVVSGDHAYAIVPATYAFEQKGRTMHEVSQMTFALARLPAGWRIVSWTWTGPEASPAN